MKHRRFYLRLPSLRGHAPIAMVLTMVLLGCRDNEKPGQPKGETGVTKDSIVFSLEKFADSLYAPLALENAHDGSGRIFIGEQAGRIMIVRDGKLLPQPFLDIRRQLVPMRNEYMDVGLLGFAFHPNYRNNGRFFVHYSAPSKKGFDNTSVLAEFRVSPDNPDRADNWQQILLEVEQPEQNHNGGNIVFDKDGYLYLGFGDGGGQGDKHGTIGNSQDLEQLLGKIVRLDVDHGQPYKVPSDNPFVGKPGRDEIWSWGMRMPWRISFDRTTGELFCGDVGQDKFEEVDIIEKGGNYGWRAMEGFHVYDSVLFAGREKYVMPVIEYPHSDGISITGGYVYRGKKYPAMGGLYVFGDWAFKMYYLEKDEKGIWKKYDSRFEGRPDNKFPFRINSFGEDEDGEIYMVTQDEVGAISPTGVVYKIGASRQ